MIIFRDINSSNVLEIAYLTNSLSPEHRKMVADNGVSIAQGALATGAWMKGIYHYDEDTEDLTPVGFIMTHTGADFDAGLDVDGVFLWRFMIATPFQGRGFGKIALEKLMTTLAVTGVRELQTSAELGSGSPLAFYKKLGFKENGTYFGEEVGLTIKLEKS